jgi:hypothetical protein
MTDDAVKTLIWILKQLDRRISALEMDSEGRGDDTCRPEIEELETVLDRERQTDGPESAPEAT